MNFQNDYRTPGHPIAFSGISKLNKTVENPRAQLSEIDSYTRFRFVARPRRFNPVYVYRKRELLQIDLAEVKHLAKHNQNINYLLVCIDTFSRKLWVKPLRTKATVEVARNMRQIIAANNDPPIERVFMDRGKEFKGAAFQRLLGEFNIEQTWTTSDSKAPHVERVIGTLKSLVHRYLAEHNTLTYIDVLDDLVKSYNTRDHTAHKMTPDEADDPANRDRALAEITKKYDKALFNKVKGPPKFKVGDVVRIVLKKRLFSRGHEQKFTDEMFKVSRVYDNLPEVQYDITTYDGSETIEGRFYPVQMQLVSGDVFKVERVIKRRVVRGQRQAYVKWQYFPDKYNQWIVEEQFVNNNDH